LERELNGKGLILPGTAGAEANFRPTMSKGRTGDRVAVE